VPLLLLQCEVVFYSLLLLRDTEVFAIKIIGVVSDELLIGSICFYCVGVCGIEVGVIYFAPVKKRTRAIITTPLCRWFLHIIITP
jgi:hypothetical protein